MMIEVLAIWDDKAKAYMQPLFMQNVPTAVRSFANAINRPDGQLAVNPEDYTLFHLGSFDDSNGSFTTRPAELVATGLQVRKSL